MTKPRSLSQPRAKTVKRLFAVSRNQCAFTGCDRPLVHEGVVVGEVCHIKGKPGGPRHDPQLDHEGLHGYDNLVLMCSEHHTMIDSDVARYPVDVLHRMKNAHIDTKLDVDIDDVANGLLNNSGFAAEVNQVAADQGINVAAANSSVVVHAAARSMLQERRILAADVLWRTALATRDAVPGFVGSRLDIVTDAEYPAMLQKCQRMIELVDFNELAAKLNRPLAESVDDHAPYLPSDLLARFHAFKTFIGRVCVLALGIYNSREHWTRDPVAMQSLNACLAPDAVAHVLSPEIGRFNRACAAMLAAMHAGVRETLT